MRKRTSDVIVLDEKTCLIRVGRDRSTLIDRADIHLVAGLAWCPVASRNGSVYAGARFESRTTYMHRLIAATTSGYRTDHINGDTLDNRRANLRQATIGQNRANAGKSARSDGSPTSSRFKGVTWDRRRGLWYASIRVQRIAASLGRFVGEEDAARAYDAAALAAWGEFAWLNFPEPTP